MDAISDVSRGSEIFSAVPTFPPLPNPLDLDELFGFSAAARRRLVEEPVETKYFIPNKIFINHVDSFTGKYIVSVLSVKQSILLCNQDLKDSVNNKGEENKNVINDRKQISPEYPTIQNASETTHKPQQEIADSEVSESFDYDTSKLTVAEYYEMMEFESLESRYNYVKDKLGKFYVDSSKADTSKYEFESILDDKTPLLDVTRNDFEIIGTVKNHITKDIEGVTGIIQTTYDDPDFIDQIVTCGIVIYCLNEDLSQVKEASWVFNYIINFKNDMTKQEPRHVCSPVLVLLSTFMTWSLTKPLSLNEDLPFIEKDYRKRKPHSNYETLYDLEELLIKTRTYHRTKAAIIVCGIPYGHEENELRYLFENALSYKHLPIYSNGNNVVPMVHVENLGQIVRKVIDKIDDVIIPFIFAKDPIQNTIAEISKGVSLNLGTGYCEYQPKEISFTNDMVSQDLYNKLTNKIYIESCYPLFKEEDISWKYETGFTENLNQIVNEFLDAKKLKPLKIIFYGEIERLHLKNIAQKVSRYLNVPHIQFERVIFDYVNEVLEKRAKYDEQKLLTDQDMQNFDFAESFNIPPMKLFLGGDEKCIEDEIEFFNKLNIHNSDEAKLLQVLDKISILARKLHKKPYVYQGYVLEEVPQNLAEANILFSCIDKDVFDNNSFSIFPDIVIFFNLKDFKSQISSELNSQRQTNEKQTFETSTVSKSFEDGKFLNTDNCEVNTLHDDDGDKTSNGNKIIIGDVSTMNEVENKITENPMFLYFTKSDQNCVVITLTINEKDDEDKIFEKTINKIKHIFLKDENEDSFSIVESFQEMQEISFDKGSKISQNSKLDNLGNENTEVLKEAEEISLAIKSCLLINYLINSISPTLTNGILELAAKMPCDPIEFLAEYIFKNNPDGRMMLQNESKLNALMKKKPVPVIDSKMCLA